MRTREVTSTIVAFALVIGACGAETTSNPATTTSGAPTTTVAPTTTDAPASTTTTTSTEVAEETVLVFFSVDGDDCAAVDRFERSVPEGAESIESAVDQLLGGPTPDEVTAGAGSFFSDETADLVQSVDLSDGVLSIDFADIRFLNNASTSCGSVALLSSLTSTAFQFDEVETVRFSIMDSCSLFWNWLQSECSQVTRGGTVPTPVDVNALALGSGCTPGTDELPDGVWFGYVTEAKADAVTFDLACWFSGAGAIEAALQVGEESPPPNGYAIRNTSAETRTISVAADVAVQWLPSDDITNLTDIGFEEWRAEKDQRDWLPGVWLSVEGGAIVSIEEQYQP